MNEERTVDVMSSQTDINGSLKVDEQTSADSKNTSDVSNVPQDADSMKPDHARDPSGPRPPSVNSPAPVSATKGGRELNKKILYVGGIDQNVTDQMLRDLFSVTGEVLSIKIFPDKNRLGFNYAFVEYGDVNGAELALHTLNKRRLNQTEILINYAYQTQQTKYELDVFNVFVGDLSVDVNDELLYTSFSKFPSIIEAHVMWDMSTGRSRGYGFVSFRDRADAESALATMDGAWIGSRQIRCNWANQKVAPNHNRGLMNSVGPSIPLGVNMMAPQSFEMVLRQAPNWQTTVYIGNLTPFTSQNDLLPLLSNFGYIVDFKYQSDRGFAFVKYDSHERAAMAIVQLSGYAINGKFLRCGWGRERNNHYHNRYHNNHQNHAGAIKHNGADTSQSSIGNMGPTAAQHGRLMNLRPDSAVNMNMNQGIPMDLNAQKYKQHQLMNSNGDMNVGGVQIGLDNKNSNTGAPIQDYQY